MLFEKTRANPPYLAEIPYGFKNLWLVTVSGYDVQKSIYSFGTPRVKEGLWKSSNII